MHSAVLFTDTNDYKYRSHLHSYYIDMHNIRFYLLSDRYCDYMFQPVKGHFKVNSGHIKPSTLNITH